MKRFRNVAVGFLGFGVLSLLVACGGGSSQISITLTTPSGVFSVDESEPSATPPVFPTLILNAAVGGDTKNQGVTWSFQKQSNCSGTGTGPGQCGTLTNPTVNQGVSQVTYTPPSDLSASLSVTVTATSISDTRVTQTTTVTVELPPTFTLTSCNPPSPPVNSPCVLPAGKNGVPYTSSGSTQVTVVFTGGVSPYNFSVSQGQLPACLNMTVSTTSQTATISGTPCGATNGVPEASAFTVTVTDSGGAPATGQLYSITIAPPPPLSITTTSLPAGLTNVTYDSFVVAQGGVAPLTWTMSPAPATSLPPGLSFNTATGEITGVPTAAALTGSSCAPAVAGTYCFSVQVTDSALIPNPSPPPAYLHQVAPAPPLPPLPLSITIQKPAPLQITTPSPLTSGTTATGYTAQLQATGGVLPYKWSLIQGQLPAGLTLSTNADSTATISGTPILAGESTFTVQVTDSEVVPATPTMMYMISVAANTTSGTANDALLQGTYAFLFNGFDDGFNGTPGSVQIVGTFTADGKGNITSGTQDSNRLSGVATGATLTGTYSLGADGRGTLELISTFAKQQPLTVDYRLVLDSSGGARFFEDNSTKTNTDSLHTHGEGVLNPVVGSSFGDASFAGNYAFLFSGDDLSNKPAALGGVIHANGSGTLTPGTSDFNDAGTFSSGTLSGEFSFLGGNRGEAALTFPLANSQPTLTFVFHFVSPSDLFFIECDSTGATTCAPGAPTLYRLAGEMILQQPNVVFNDTVLQGTSVVSGVGLNGSNSDVFAGLLTTTTCDGSTPMSLNYDENNGGTVPSPSPSFSGTCTMGLNGNGRVGFSGLGSSAAQTKVAAAYLTGPGQGFVLGSDTAVTTGLLEQQSGNPFADSSVLGSYAMSAPLIAETNVKNVLGQVTGDGLGDLTGVIDEIDPPATSLPNLAQALASSFSSLAASGRGTLTTTAPVPNGFPTSGIFYIVSPSSFRMISADASDQHPNLFFFNH